MRQDFPAAHAIAAAVLGCDPGPMTHVDSSSHDVYVGADVVVKIIDATRHKRLNREITLASRLPVGLTAPLLDSGRRWLGTREIRWFFLARFSGPHLETVLDVVARVTKTPLEVLRAECEVRNAAHLAFDLRVAFERPDFPAGLPADRLRGLEELTLGRYWWRHAR